MKTFFNRAALFFSLVSGVFTPQTEKDDGNVCVVNVWNVSGTLKNTSDEQLAAGPAVDAASCFPLHVDLIVYFFSNLIKVILFFNI